MWREMHLMAVKMAKQFVYRYNGVESSDEVEQDLAGEMEVPAKDGFLNIKGKIWRVNHVITERSRKSAIPVVRLFLTDQF